MTPLVSTALLVLIFTVGPDLSYGKLCGVVGSGQADPFGLQAQATGNFVPPVPTPPAKRRRPLLSSSGWWNRAPTDTDNFSAFQQLMTLLQGRRRKRDAEKRNARVRRIVGGYDATPGQLCWQVKVQIGAARDETICGGTILGSQTILIAAHCVFNSDTRRRFADSQITVIVGGMNRDVGESYGIDTTGCAERFGVARSIIHPSYNYDLNDNDIGLLALSRKIDLDNKPCACPACLNSRTPQPSEWCVVSGFGEESNDGLNDRNPVPLKWTQLQVRVQDYSGNCAYNTLTSPITRALQHTALELFLCAGAQPWEDTCQGDSGGPMICLDPVKRTYYQAGIVSFGDECGTGVGGQYTKVALYIPWILANAVPGDVILS